ncbi:MAG: hypothetical protein QXT63_01475 [Thermoplasmata archaeon]
MATDGVFTVTSPNYPTENAQNAFDEIRENFEYIRRQFMITGIIPITGTNISYTYTGEKLTSISISGSVTGSASFTYTGDNLTQEVWSLYGKTITINHTYSGNQITSSSITLT